MNIARYPITQYQYCSYPSCVLCFEAKLSVSNGHLPNTSDNSLMKPSQDAARPHNVSTAEKQQKTQVTSQCCVIMPAPRFFVALLRCIFISRHGDKLPKFDDSMYVSVGIIVQNILLHFLTQIITTYSVIYRN